MKLEATEDLRFFLLMYFGQIRRNEFGARQSAAELFATSTGKTATQARIDIDQAAARFNDPIMFFRVLINPLD